MRKILVPCDFSATAMNAVAFAISLARQSDGHVDLLNVIEMPLLQDPIVMPAPGQEARFLNELHEDVNERFEGILNDERFTGVSLSTEVEVGNVYQVIQEAIIRNSTDLVVMGTHGASGFQELFVGSNAQKVVQKSPVPVLVVKDAVTHPIKHIIFPNSLHLEGQEDLIEELKSLQDFFDAQIHIVWINTPLNFTSDRITQHRLEIFAKKYHFKNCTTHVFNHPQEEEGIMAFAEVINADLIALGTHGRRGMAHFMSGSLAEDLVNHAERPVWTYCAKDAVEAG